MTTVQVAPARRSREPVICPTDEEAVVPKKPEPARKAHKKSAEYILKSGLAGGLAGCAAKTVVGPLDRVKILFQTSNPNFTKYAGKWSGLPVAIKDIYIADGPRGLFKGHSATLLRIFPYAGIKFLAYEQIRARFIKDHTQETSVRRFLSGASAGCVSVFFTYPLEVIRVRLAFETRNESRSTLRSICRIIYNERPPPIHVEASQAAVLAPLTTATAAVQKVAPRYGLSNFFRGFTPTLLGMLPYAGASFLAHDTASDILRYPLLAPYTTIPSSEGSAVDPNKPAQLRYWAELGTGGFAGFTSQTVSYPLEVIRRRMQVGGVVGDGHRLGMAEVIKRINKERGYRGFFVGLTIGYVKIIPMSAVSFYVYERGKYYLGI
ncbi:ADP,ATP carrier protein [Mytilinidion resinicola]|uniref:Mitochondrial thiamine pyrophosphate carrier 1 n=1 Tax=Mytilinidion resinicola TaxID=574789 RepID=A0A6A6YWS6_9PEZI|nr:ADP,ATP carrier protein [Mytilinidion resinicola]KAF2813261.1 ADP,ATP carrier protein [Mytilinidion resinicola]